MVLSDGSYKRGRRCLKLEVEKNSANHVLHKSSFKVQNTLKIIFVSLSPYLLSPFSCSGPLRELLKNRNSSHAHEKGAET